MTNFEDENPWLVSNIDEFLYFCCPECDERNQSKELFLKHAFDEHPKAKQILGDLKVKDEPLEEPFEQSCLDIQLTENYENSENFDPIYYYNNSGKSQISHFVEINTVTIVKVF